MQFHAAGAFSFLLIQDLSYDSLQVKEPIKNFNNYR